MTTTTQASLAGGVGRAVSAWASASAAGHLLMPEEVVAAGQHSGAEWMTVSTARRTSKQALPPLEHVCILLLCP
jgi:hypothetical protein